MPNAAAPEAQESSGSAVFRRGSGSGSHPHRGTRGRETHPTWVRKSNPLRLVIRPLAWPTSAIAAGSREVAHLDGIPCTRLGVAATRAFPQFLGLICEGQGQQRFLLHLVGLGRAGGWAGAGGTLYRQHRTLTGDAAEAWQHVE